MTECWPCPAGYRCDASSKTQCASRQYSLMYDTTCHACPRGFICADGKDYTQCPDGTYSDPDSDICKVCDPDNFCINGVQSACEDGLGGFSNLTLLQCYQVHTLASISLKTQ